MLKVALFCVAFVWVATTVFMLDVPFTGDEGFYRRNAYHLAQWLIGDGPATAELGSFLVGNGWFMPGSSILMIPINFFDQPSLEVTRLYMALVVAALSLWAAREIWLSFGRLAVAGFMIFPGVSLTWQMMGKTVWAEVVAGLLLAIVICRLYRFVLQAVSHGHVSFREILAFELILITMMYMRGSALPVAVASNIVLLVLPFLIAPSRRWLMQSWKVVLGAILCAALLAPWSILASTKLGGRVMTTSTVTLSLGITFGDRSKLCFGPCPEGSIWHNTVDFSREVAAEEQRSELAVQKDMSAAALEGLTTARYFQQVRRNFANLFLSPNGFTERFFDRHTKLSEGLKTGAVPDVVRRINQTLYYPALVLLVLANLWVVRRSPPTQVLSLVLKIATVCILLQPFLHPAHERYWPGFAPLMGLSAFFVLARLAPSWAEGWVSATGPQDDLSANTTVLTALQVLYVVMALAVAAVVAFG